MAPNFTDDDIRQQLAELGYPSIAEDRLRVFAKDLRRLMKYEEKKRLVAAAAAELREEEEEDRENRSPRQKTYRRRSLRVAERIQYSSSTSTTTTTTTDRSNGSRDEPDRILHQASRQQITLTRVRTAEGIGSTSKQPQATAATVQLTSSSNSSCRQESSSTSSSSCLEASSLYIDVYLPRAASAADSVRPPLAASLLEQPQAGFIRCRSSQALAGKPGRKEGRSDPVTLHQEYKKHWDKLNLPGVARHDKLRWAVRGWMMGEEPK